MCKKSLPEKAETVRFQLLKIERKRPFVFAREKPKNRRCERPKTGATKRLPGLFYLHTKSYTIPGLPILRIFDLLVFDCSYFLLPGLFSMTFLDVIVHFDRSIVFRPFNNTFFRCKRRIFKHLRPVHDRRNEHRNERRIVQPAELSECLVVDGRRGCIEAR